MLEKNYIEWDIDTNLPVYTTDFYKLYSIGGHVCDCHREDERCLGCETQECSFHERNGVRRVFNKEIVEELNRVFPDGYELYTGGKLYARKDK